MVLNLKKIISVLLFCSLLLACDRRQNIVQGYVEGYFRYLSSNSAGFLSSLSVARGTPVKSGQLLFILENQPEAYQVAQAQQKLRQAQFDLVNLEKGERLTILQGIEQQISQANAELQLARKTFERNQQLVKTEAISKQQFDQAKADFESANARLNQQIANLNEAKLGARTDVIKAAKASVGAAIEEANVAAWYLVKKSITAPADGIIFDTYYRQGELVPAGRPVVSMLVPPDIRVIFYVSEPYLNQIHLGDSVTVDCDGCKQKHVATVTFISSQAEFTPPTIFSERERRKFVYRIEARFDPKDSKEIHPGQPVDVRLRIKD